MGKRLFINIGKDLKGKSVLVTDTGKRVGEVSDVIIHPLEGRLLGIEIRNENRRYAVIQTNQFVIGPDAVMAKSEVFFGIERNSIDLESGVRALETVHGANIVTEDGKFLGRISNVYLHPEMNRTAYEIAESSLKHFFGKSCYISGDTPIAFSQEGGRLIVPSNTEDALAVGSLNDTVQYQESATAAKSSHV